MVDKHLSVNVKKIVSIDIVEAFPLISAAWDLTTKESVLKCWLKSKFYNPNYDKSPYFVASSVPNDVSLNNTTDEETIETDLNKEISKLKRMNLIQESTTIEEVIEPEEEKDAIVDASEEDVSHNEVEISKISDELKALIEKLGSLDLTDKMGMFYAKRVLELLNEEFE
ncbi:hypothetical protein EIN_499600 [Entamoeba invadens IP1]|uniref:DDE-1 domain-containing protein n=1 Tax=Entamoeba invadens IP1 TaxID=370355 RepID=A0A0A1UGA4_ENTIV|nr:hypothetical protein EIN_499600 [Entamoeba invadens IP1]ELP94670.1 hypothetical protein EIN_499600 [Entamoeba invadens IP1]|eukprot:XP_004261441.1 hypothetical protein EIN_499600 [Entamoeba invadens IP1]